jgi:hypothetical protein
MKEFFGEKKWNKMFTFAIIRDPVEHTLSEYRFSKTFISLDAFLDVLEEHEVEHLAYSQWPYLMDDKNCILVDYVGNFCRLEKCFGDICKRLEIDVRKLPHINKTGEGPPVTMAQKNRIRDLFYLDYNFFFETLR